MDKLVNYIAGQPLCDPTVRSHDDVLSEIIFHSCLQCPCTSQVVVAFLYGRNIMLAEWQVWTSAFSDEVWHICSARQHSYKGPYKEHGHCLHSSMVGRSYHSPYVERALSSVWGIADLGTRHFHLIWKMLNIIQRVYYV